MKRLAVAIPLLACIVLPTLLMKFEALLVPFTIFAAPILTGLPVVPSGLSLYLSNVPLGFALVNTFYY